MSFLFANRATSQLVRALAADETSMLVSPGGGVLFPAPAVGDRVALTITAVDGTVEFVHCTARIGDEFTIERAQENSAAASFAIGSRVDLRLTAGVLADFLQKSSPSLTAALEMNGNAIRNTRFPQQTYIDTVQTKALVAADGNPARAILLPDGGGLPSYGGTPIMTQFFFQTCVFAIWADANNIPAHFKVCDGSNGTPDLRTKFILGAFIGVSGQEPGQVGGSFGVNVEPNGSHSHGGGTGGHPSGDYSLPPLTITRTRIAVQGLGAPPNETVLKEINVTYGAPGPNHFHSIGADGFHGHVATCVPPYMALLYVMFR